MDRIAYWNTNLILQNTIFPETAAHGYPSKNDSGDSGTSLRCGWEFRQNLLQALLHLFHPLPDFGHLILKSNTVLKVCDNGLV